LVVDNPAGLVVHPGAGHAEGTLVNALLAHGPKLSGRGGPVKPGLVHRLDKDTSGIMVVAKDDATHWNLSRQFAGRSVLRVYQAVVRGRMQRDEGTIDAPIGRHPVQRKKMAVRRDSERDAITKYKVLKRFKEATLVELYPQTGRTHQLRVHLASIGHPILGDTEYGVSGGFSRQALHAHRLGFVHPGIEQRVEFVSPLPRDLERQIARLT
jgi:23S rRNA pseudouridine1911/1915/1917 synthase